MFSIFLSLILHNKINSHTCDHDFIQDQTLRESSPKKIGFSSHVPTDIHSRQNIRLIFNLDSIFDPTKDNKQCKFVNETGKTNPCLEGHVLDSTKRDTINKTIYNLQKYIQPLLKVDPYLSSIDLSTVSAFNDLVLPSSVSDCDLYVAVVARPYPVGSTTLASASSQRQESTNQRPIIGMININPLMLPGKFEDYNTPERQFFTTALHELMHILAFSSNLFPDWYDPVSGTSHSNNVVSYNNQHGITQTFLSTPNLLSWVHQRFNVHSSTYVNLGLEIEDGGGAGTAGSHPNARLFFSDLMQGKTYGIAYIGPIFFLSLIDSGWYTLNETTRLEFEEEFVYLDISLSSRNERIRENILIESGWHTFPKSYFCDQPDTSRCFYDYATKGVCYLKKSTSYSTISYFVQSWYNPLSKDYIGDDDLLDHLPLILPATASNCRSIESPNIIKAQKGFEHYDPLVFAETYGNTSVCAMSTLYNDKMGGFLPMEIAACFNSWCGTDNRVRLHIGGKELFCREDGMRFTVPGYGGYVICPQIGRAHV